MVNGASMRRELNQMVLLHALIFSLKAAQRAGHQPRWAKPTKNAVLLTPGAGAIRARLRLVLSWDTDIPTSIFMSLRLTVNMPGTVTSAEKQWRTGYGCHDRVRTRVFAMPAPVHGRYQVYINYFGGAVKRN